MYAIRSYYVLVANLYDAYSIEKEGRFSEHILGEYYQLNLSSVPRITGVSSFEEAMEQLEAKHFDLIILMVGVDKSQPFDISSRIHIAYPYIPIYVLLNSNADIRLFEQRPGEKDASIVITSYSIHYTKLYDNNSNQPR